MKTLRGIGSLWVFVLVWFATCAPAAAQTMRAHFIDVGQGAATLVEFPCAALLIDTGGESNREFESNGPLLEYLETFFNSRPDLGRTLHSLILTHPHIDHTRGVKSVLSKYRVLNAVTNSMETGSGRLGQIALHNKVAAGEETDDPSDDIGYAAIWQKDIPPQGLTNGVIDPVDCGSVDPKITALWGRVGTELNWIKTDLENANNSSVVVRIDFGRASMLIAGDIENAAIAALISRYSGTRMLDVDVIQVSHHGAANGTTAPLLRATTPDFAVIQMGPQDRELANTAWAYGHPRKVTIDLLQSFVSKTRSGANASAATAVKRFVPVTLTRAIYGTGWDGAVVLEADVHGVWKPFDASATPQLIDLNSASAQDLVSLPMIGTARAQAIVAFRQQIGRFTRLEDLLQIRGIKTGTLSAIRNLVMVR